MSHICVQSGVEQREGKEEEEEEESAKQNANVKRKGFVPLTLHLTVFHSHMASAQDDGVAKPSQYESKRENRKKEKDEKNRG